MNSVPTQLSASTRSPWLILLVIGFWSLLGLLYLSSLTLNAQQFDTTFRLTSKTFFGTQLVFLNWSFVTFFVFWLMERSLIGERSKAVGVKGRSGRVTLSAMLLVVALIWIPYLLVADGLIGDWMFDRGRRTPLEVLLRTDYFSVFFVGILYLLICVAGLGLAYSKRWRLERERTLELNQRDARYRMELSDLHMQLLKSQLSPHFLFNSLGSVSALARSAPRSQIIDTVQAIGDLLRYALTTSTERTVSLDAEIGFTQNYVQLQSLRFDDRFEFKLDNQVQAHTSCPPFMLQTLVENAFVHGVEQSSDHTRIIARIAISADRLLVEVTNDRPSSVRSADGLGIAMNNLKRRLDLQFDQQATCVGRADGPWYRACVSIPLDVLNDE